MSQLNKARLVIWGHLAKGLADRLIQAVTRLVQGANLEKLVLLTLIVIAPILAFYNLEYAPRPWHDEGAAMSLAKTLAREGVYAVRNADGYQTFGPVQSVGPTVILPVALSFRLLGVGILQGRIVMAGYLILTVLIFYGLSSSLFSRRTALLAVLLLLGAPNGVLFFGRQVLGEVAALGFYLSSWLVWSYGVQTKRRWSFLVEGLLIGAAMLTKSSYIVMGGGTLILLFFLDLLYYRQGNTKSLLGIGFVALVMVSIWILWQRVYFGAETFQQNAALMGQLGANTTGFNLRLLPDLVRFLIGEQSEHFYFWWGVPALAYAAGLSFNKSPKGFVFAGLFIFTVLWLAYYFWSVPWPSYLFVPVAITSLFVAKLATDLIDAVGAPWSEFWSELRQGKVGKGGLALAVLGVMALVILYTWQNALTTTIVTKDTTPEQVADFLNKSVKGDAIVETWERELGILTEHRYHYPDQSLLIKAHAALYRNGSPDFALGTEYFALYRPAYVVVGWYARWVHVYDPTFLNEHAELVTTIGSGFYTYEVYKVHLP